MELIVPNVDFIPCDTVLHISEVINLSHSQIIFCFLQNKFVVAATPCCSEAWYMVCTAVAEAISRHLRTRILLNIKT